MSRSNRAPRYLKIEQAVEALLIGQQQHQQLLSPRTSFASNADDHKGNESNNITALSDQQRRKGKKRQRSDVVPTLRVLHPDVVGEEEKCEEEDVISNVHKDGECAGEDSERRRRLSSHSLCRAANVVAIVTDVSEAQPTASSRLRNDSAAQMVMWIQDDESLQGGDLLPHRPHHRAAVAYWQSASASATSSTTKKKQSPHQLLRAGDVVALHGLVLRKSCLHQLGERRRLTCGGEHSTDDDIQPPYEFVHDANATVFHDHPLLEKVRLLARIDPVSQRVHRYDTDVGSPAMATGDNESILSRRVSELVQWYLSKSRKLDGPLSRTFVAAAAEKTEDDEDARHCRQRSVAELQSTLDFCAHRISHVVAHIAAIQDHRPNDAFAQRKEASRSSSLSRKRRSTTPRSPTADSAATFVLLKDSSSSVPIPLVLLGKNNVHKFRDQLKGLISTDAPNSSEQWVRWTRLRSVRMLDALRGTSFDSGDIDDTAVALVPTESTTVTLVPQEEVSDFYKEGSFLLSQLPSASASLAASQPAQSAHSQMPASTTVTVEAPIASIRIVVGTTLTARAGASSQSPPTTVVLDAANVHGNILQVLVLLRQHIQSRGSNVQGSNGRLTGDVDDIAVSITLDCHDAALARAVGCLPVGPQPRAGLVASRHVVHILFWGGAKWESVMSGKLDDICGRMVAGMLQESVRFHWILERQNIRSDGDGAASYRIVDMSLREL